MLRKRRALRAWNSPGIGVTRRVALCSTDQHVRTFTHHFSGLNSEGTPGSPQSSIRHTLAITMVGPGSSSGGGADEEEEEEDEDEEVGEEEETGRGGVSMRLVSAKMVSVSTARLTPKGTMEEEVRGVAFGVILGEAWGEVLGEVLGVTLGVVRGVEPGVVLGVSLGVIQGEMVYESGYNEASVGVMKDEPYPPRCWLASSSSRRSNSASSS